MRIAVASDEPYPIHEHIVGLLEARGHDVVRYGSLTDGAEHSWAMVAEQAARAVAGGECAQAVLLCWTGTGISMAANKVPGIRAALCGDAQTAAGARVWNDANALCLSNRTLSPDIASEILTAWFDTPSDPCGADGISNLADVDRRNRS